MVMQPGDLIFINLQNVRLCRITGNIMAFLSWPLPEPLSWGPLFQSSKQQINRASGTGSICSFAMIISRNADYWKHFATIDTSNDGKAISLKHLPWLLIIAMDHKSWYIISVQFLADCFTYQYIYIFHNYIELEVNSTIFVCTDVFLYMRYISFLG